MTPEHRFSHAFEGYLKELQYYYWLATPLHLDLAENIMMKIIFSTYHEIRDSGKERTSCCASMRTSVYRLFEWKMNRKMKEVKPHRTSSTHDDELDILILRTRGKDHLFDITTRQYVGSMDANMRSDRLVSNHEWTGVRPAEIGHTVAVITWLKFVLREWIAPHHSPQNVRHFTRCDKW